MRHEAGLAKEDRLFVESKKAKEVEHDIHLAKKVRDLFPKSLRRSFVYNIYNNHMYLSRHSRAIYLFLHEVSDSDFVFVNGSISNKIREVIDIGYELSNFLGFKFWMWPEFQRGEEEFSFALWPWGNVDRAGTGHPEQMQAYDELTTEMEKKVSAFNDAFNDLLKLFHTELHLHDEAA